MFRLLLLLALILIPLPAFAQKGAASSNNPEAQVREAIRQYDDALRRADADAAAKFWADEYVFINPRGERLTREDRIANVKSGATAFDSLAHVPEKDEIRVHGDVATYITLLAIHGKYSGEGQEGTYRGLVVWLRKNGKWQQIASQLTPVLPR